MTAISQQANDVIELEVVPCDDGTVSTFRPGQHIMLSLPGTDLTRAYSLTGRSGRNSLSIAIKRSRDPSGETPHLSDQLHRLNVGDEVAVEGPRGIFTPPLSGNRPVIFIAGGIGITPFVGHLRALAERTAHERVARLLLLHGCRNGSEHPFAGRLHELTGQLPQLERVTAFSAPRAQDRCPQDYDYAGRLDLSPVGALLPERPLAYICGSPNFTTAMTAQLIARGMPRFDIFTEAFASPPAVPKTLTPQTIHIAGSDKSFVWTPELGTILDAAEAAGLALPSGCRVGQCESCAMRIVEGNVARLAIEDDQPDQCLTCQAVPLSELTLAL